MLLSAACRAHSPPSCCGRTIRWLRVWRVSDLGRMCPTEGERVSAGLGGARKSHDLAQADELGHRAHFQLVHNLPTALLHRRFGDRKVSRDLLIEVARDHRSQHIAFAEREPGETFLERRALARRTRTLAVTVKRLANCIDQYAVVDRFAQILDR